MTYRGNFFCMLFFLAICTHNTYAQEDGSTTPTAGSGTEAPATGAAVAPAATNSSDPPKPVSKPKPPTIMPHINQAGNFKKPPLPERIMPEPEQPMTSTPVKEKKKLKIDWSKMGDFIDGLIGVVISAGAILIIAVPVAIVAVTQFK